MCLTPCSVATEFSILRATSVSSCAGDAPGSEAVTVTVGRSMSGKFWIFIARKPSTPASVSMTNSRMAGVGLRIDQAETFMLRLGVELFAAAAAGLAGSAPACASGAGPSTTRTVSPSPRKPPPDATTTRGLVQPAGDLDAIADAPADRDLGLDDLRVRRRRAARS